jgi:hypothetical protein
MIFAWSIITNEITDQAFICQCRVKKIAHFVSASVGAASPDFPHTPEPPLFARTTLQLALPPLSGAGRLLNSLIAGLCSKQGQVRMCY